MQVDSVTMFEAKSRNAKPLCIHKSPAGLRESIADEGTDMGQIMHEPIGVMSGPLTV